MPEPHRLVHDAEGFNTAIESARVVDSPITPASHFFTRSHATPPTIDPATWRLTIDGLVRHLGSYSLEELGSAFPSRTVDATLMCAGLRRAELLAVAPMPGELPWGSEAVSTGRWSGTPLRALLDVVQPTRDARFVEFTGLDDVERHGKRAGFGGSIDLDKASTEDVLVATHLNGSALAAVHGFPARALVPGWYGARSVKWLGRITLRDRPSDNYFQTHAYRVQRTVQNGDPRDVSGGVPLGEVPLNSVIAEPVAGSTLAAGATRIHGWAIGAGGAAICRVELSTDAITWLPATLRQPDGKWTWTLWEITVPLAAGTHQLIVRAMDEAGNVQPETLAESWNVKGYANTAWQRVDVVVR